MTPRRSGSRPPESAAGGGRPPAELEFVRKRDGRRVPFEPDKVAGAVGRALGSVQESDPGFAEDVAAIVTLVLEREVARGDHAATGDAPHIEDVQDKVEQALIELGRAPVAKAYILYRDRRSRARDMLVAEPSKGDEARPIRVRQSDSTQPWSKARIAAALVREADLPRETAEEVARRVEVRVFESGLKTLSTGLIRAMVEAELVELGLTAALAHTEPVSLPRHDLRRALAGEGAETWEPWLRAGEVVTPEGRVQAPERIALGSGFEATLSGELLRRYSLSELLDARSAELHLAGDFQVEDLHAPHLFLQLSLPAELALGGLALGALGAESGGGSSAEGALGDGALGESAFALLDVLGALLRSTSRGLVLEEIGPLFGELMRATRSGSALGLTALLRSLAAVGAAAGRRVDLLSPGPRFGALRLRLIESLELSADRPHSVRMYLDEQELHELLEGDARGVKRLEQLVARGRLIPVWSRAERRFVAPGCRRGPRERGVLSASGAVALNLPRIARSTGPWREEAFLAELYGLAKCAVEAARSLARFQEQTAAARPIPLLPRAGFALVPVGLDEALTLLGEGSADPEQGARILGLLSEVAERGPGPGGPSFTVSPFFGDAARLRFAWLDEDERVRFRPRQPLLFGMPGGDGEPSAASAYSIGFGLRHARPWASGEAEAECVRTLSSGALFPPLRPAGSAANESSLARFHAARAAQRLGPEHELLPMEQRDPQLRLLRDEAAPDANRGPQQGPKHGPSPEPELQPSLDASPSKLSSPLIPGDEPQE